MTKNSNKRGPGRPASGTAKSNAERQAIYRERQRLMNEIQEVPEHVKDALHAYLKAQMDWYNDDDNSYRIERKLHDQAMNVCAYLGSWIATTQPNSKTAELWNELGETGKRLQARLDAKKLVKD